VTIAYDDLKNVSRRVSELDAAGVFAGTEFSFERVDESGSSSSSLRVIDPWGTVFYLTENPSAADPRGSQPGEISEGLAVTDLTVHVPPGTNFAGIGRFYERILGSAPTQIRDDSEEKSCCVVVPVGPTGQTLTFLSYERPDDKAISHVELSSAPPGVEGSSAGVSNHGVHISMYLADLRSVYEAADSLGLAYVNPRFKRRAHNLEEALRDCMFRCIDIVDPEAPHEGPIVQIEHEIRSVLKEDGSMYRSCPFDEIPEQCLK